MPKPKVESLVVESINGDYQCVVINGNRHEFNIYLSPHTVIDKLSEYYDFSYLDRKDLEVMW